jgi:hypothetical protein
MSPFMLFALNILTLGMRSIFWVNYHLPSLIAMARGDEMLQRGTLGVWFISHAASLAFLGSIGWEFFATAFDVSDLSINWLFRGALASIAVSFLVSRHVLLWMRNVIMDALDKSEHDVVRVRTAGFARSQLLLWFIGAPYIQFHINRMIRKKGLQGYGAARRQRQVDMWLAAVRGPDGELPPKKPRRRYLKN